LKFQFSKDELEEVKDNGCADSVANKVTEEYCELYIYILLITPDFD